MVVLIYFIPIRNNIFHNGDNVFKPKHIILNTTIGLLKFNLFSMNAIIVLTIYDFAFNNYL